MIIESVILVDGIHWFPPRSPHQHILNNVPGTVETSERSEFLFSFSLPFRQINVSMKSLKINNNNISLFS